MVAPDRPGLGLSDFHPRRTILDFVRDVTELADHLRLNQFAVLGVSGGGPYAIACASAIPDRLTAALLVCSMGPADAPEATKNMVAINRWLLAIARRYPRVAQCIGGLCLRAIWRKGNQAIPKQIEARLPPADRRALQSSELRQALTDASIEALHHGAKAAAADGLLYGKPWGFELGQIRANVALWHGEADVIVPPSMGHYLAERIPNCQSRFYPDDGHFSLPYNRVEEILKQAC